MQSGDLSKYERIGASGKPVIYNTCAICPTVLYSECEAIPGMKILKTGTLDNSNELAMSKPTAELYVCSRVGWCSAYPETVQHEQGL